MNKLITHSIAVLLSSFISAAALADEHEAIKAYIVSPANGETVSTTFKVIFGLSGMGVSPAGIKREKTGHHHLLIDMKSLPPLDQPLGAEVKHFGGGQTETTLTLSPGQHTLQLILGDHLHRPHSPPVISDTVTIEVK